MMRRCPMCFTEYEVYKNAPTKYCSRECSNKAQTLRQLGEKSHFWEGGKVDANMHIRNHHLYDDWRKKVFTRDDYTCQSCFRHSSEIDSAKKLTAHHIIAFAQEPKTRLKVSNGITLCWQCHTDFHRYVRLGTIADSHAALVRSATDFFEGEPGVKFIKFHGSPMQQRGTPDFLGSVAGWFVAIEMKVPPDFLSPIQKVQLRLWKDTGAATFICRSLDEVKRAIRVVKEAMPEVEPWPWEEQETP